MALWLILVFAVAGYFIEGENVDRVLSGMVPPWYLAVIFGCIVVASFAASALSDWEQRRRRRHRTPH
jgi:hypothetical protein